MTYIDVTFEDAKQQFFDRRRVIDAIGKGKADALRKVGTYIRTTAKSSIRKPGTTKKTRISKPGKPPRNQTGKLKQKIFAYYVPNPDRAVIGPVLWRAPKSPVKNINYPSAAGTLEHGGMVTGPKRIKTTTQGKYIVKGLFVAKIEARPYMGPAAKIAFNNGKMDEYLGDLMHPRYAKR